VLEAPYSRDIARAGRVFLADAGRGAPLARQYVRGQILMWCMDDLAGNAGLSTSDLVTNAITHAPGDSITVWLSCSAVPVRISAWDTDDDRLPETVPVGADAEGGRGLVLAGTMADYRGPYKADNGKAVSAALPGRQS
jgi:anti-sigma regulatory factor (Ser/Thr protein kinase)